MIFSTFVFSTFNNNHTYSLTNVHIQKKQYFCLKLIQYLPTQRYKHAGSYNRIRCASSFKSEATDDSPQKHLRDICDSIKSSLYQNKLLLGGQIVSLNNKWWKQKVQVEK